MQRTEASGVSKTSKIAAWSHHAEIALAACHDKVAASSVLMPRYCGSKPPSAPSASKASTLTPASSASASLALRAAAASSSSSSSSFRCGAPTTDAQATEPPRTQATKIGRTTRTIRPRNPRPMSRARLLRADVDIARICETLPNPAIRMPRVLSLSQGHSRIRRTCIERRRSAPLCLGESSMRAWDWVADKKRRSARKRLTRLRSMTRQPETQGGNSEQHQKHKVEIIGGVSTVCHTCVWSRVFDPRSWDIRLSGCAADVCSRMPPDAE